MKEIEKHYEKIYLMNSTYPTAFSLCFVSVIAADGTVRSFMEIAGDAVKFHKTGRLLSVKNICDKTLS